MILVRAPLRIPLGGGGTDLPSYYEKSGGFILSAAIGALAGCVTSPLTQTHYGMGSALAVKGFAVAILGGMGNSMAAVAAGIILGLLESFSISIFPMAYKDAIAVLILIIVLVVKPSGIFGSKEAAALKEF